MSVLRSLLTTGVLIYGLWLWILPVNAQSAPQVGGTATWQVTPQRSPDNACLKCHKDDQEGMHGEHRGEINPNNQLPITCTNCHGKPSMQHRENGKDVMRFNQPDYTVEQQNSICMTCHEPEKLQQAFWTHDVHLSKVSCASCHQLHPTEDHVQTLNEKERIQLCVDCHRQQHDNPAFNPSSVHLNKEQP